MRPRSLIAVVLATVVARGAAAQRCRPVDNESARLIVELQDWMTTTDPERMADRDTLFKIPVVSPSQVVLVTDERICTKASDAYGPKAGSTEPARVYTIKLGTKGYAVYDPDQPAGEYRVVMILNTKFTQIGGWTG